MSFGLFRVKTVISNQNRVHRVNTGQTMSTRVKNEFRVVSGQNRHFRPKPSSPGQDGSNHVDQGKKWVSGCFGSKPSFPTKTESLGQYGSNHVDQGKKWVSGCFGSKTVIFDHNPVHRVDTHQMFFLIFYFFFCGWNRLFLILIWIFNFTYINIYYYI
jgi:hypothetical protein